MDKYRKGYIKGYNDAINDVMQKIDDYEKSYMKKMN
jgi:hypothetical protein